MYGKRKNTVVFDMDDYDENEPLRKQLLSVQEIRKKRLNRHETEYKKKQKKLEDSRLELKNDEKELELSEKKCTDGKALLRSQYLNALSTMGDLKHWGDQEEALKKSVSLAGKKKETSKIKVEDNKKITLDAKKKYQETLLSIEKIDFFLEEL